MKNTPKLEDLLSKVDSKYTLVIMAAKRARQVNEYLQGLHRPGILKYRPPAVDFQNKKPLAIALEEIAEDKLSYTRETNGIK